MVMTSLILLLYCMQNKHLMLFCQRVHHLATPPFTMSFWRAQPEWCHAA